MANNLGSLVVSLGLDAGEFTRGLSKSEYQAQQFARKLQVGMEAARVAAIGSLTAIVGAALVLDRQLQSIAGFQDLADKIGDSAQEVASLKLAADLSGVSLENVASASVKLTTALSKMDEEGSGAGKALEAIGLKIEDFRRLSPVAQIDAVAKAMADFEDGASKTAVAVALFGKSGADLIPLLNDLAEEGERQISLTGDQIKAADDYSKSVARLTSEVQTMVAVTAADAAPAMSGMVQILRDVFTYAKSSADGVDLLSIVLSGATEVLKTVVIIGSDVAFVFKQTGIEIGGMAAQLAALSRFDFSGFTAISDAMKDDSARARAELDAFQKKVMEGKSASNDYFLSFQKDPKKVLGFSATKTPDNKGSSQISDAQKYLDNLRQQEQAFANLTAEQKAIADIESGRFKNITENQKQAIINAAKELDLTRELSEIDKELRKGVDDGNRARTKALNDQEDLIKAMIDATPTVQLERQRSEMQLLAKAFEDGRINAEQFTEAASTRLGIGMEKVNEQIKESKTLAEELGLTFQSAFEDAITSGSSFGDVLKSLAKDVLKLIVRKQVTEPVLGAVRGLDFSKLFSFAGGGYTGDGSRAGGMDGQGGYLAMLHPQETVVDHAKGQGMGGTSINQNITIDARGADAGVTERIMQAMRQTKAETLAAVQAQANRGGSFARSVGRG
jgi:hypothetical protein